MKQFHKATKAQSFLRMALVGPSGSGKTYSSLRIAQGLGSKIALIDSERRSASKYADDFNFDAVELDTSFSPHEYMEAIQAAVEGGYEVLIIDSLSHAWSDKGGILEMKDAVASQHKSENDFTAWRHVTPKHNELVDSILRAPLHVIVTMRAKTEYVTEKNEQTGKTTIRKVGLKPVQRDGLEYEFDVVGDLDQDNTLIINKTRCKALNQAVIHEPGETNVAKVLKTWLTEGAPAPISEAQGKELWQAARAKGLSVLGLVHLINNTLQTVYTNPRELNVQEYPKAVAAVDAYVAPTPNEGEAAS